MAAVDYQSYCRQRASVLVFGYIRHVSHEFEALYPENKIFYVPNEIKYLITLFYEYGINVYGIGYSHYSQLSVSSQHTQGYLSTLTWLDCLSSSNANKQQHTQPLSNNLIQFSNTNPKHRHFNKQFSIRNAIKIEQCLQDSFATITKPTDMHFRFIKQNSQNFENSNSDNGNNNNTTTARNNLKKTTTLTSRVPDCNNRQLYFWGNNRSNIWCIPDDDTDTNYYNIYKFTKNIFETNENKKNKDNKNKNKNENENENGNVNDILNNNTEDKKQESKTGPSDKYSDSVLEQSDLGWDSIGVNVGKYNYVPDMSKFDYKIPKSRNNIQSEYDEPVSHPFYSDDSNLFIVTRLSRTHGLCNHFFVICRSIIPDTITKNYQQLIFAHGEITEGQCGIAQEILKFFFQNMECYLKKPFLISGIKNNSIIQCQFDKLFPKYFEIKPFDSDNDGDYDNDNIYNYNNNSNNKNDENDENIDNDKNSTNKNKNRKKQTKEEKMSEYYAKQEEAKQLLNKEFRNYASFSFDNSDIVDIVCGTRHTLFLTQNGNVFACGENRHGQCGVRNDRDSGLVHGNNSNNNEKESMLFNYRNEFEFAVSWNSNKHCVYEPCMIDFIQNLSSFARSKSTTFNFNCNSNDGSFFDGNSVDGGWDNPFDDLLLSDPNFDDKHKNKANEENTENNKNNKENHDCNQSKTNEENKASDINIKDEMNTTELTNVDDSNDTIAELPENKDSNETRASDLNSNIKAEATWEDIFAFDNENEFFANQQKFDNSNSSFEVLIKQIDCGDSHSLCLDTRGRVWIFGSNIYGQINGFPYKNPSKYHNSRRQPKNSKKAALNSSKDTFELPVVPASIKQQSNSSNASSVGSAGLLKRRKSNKKSGSASPQNGNNNSENNSNNSNISNNTKRNEIKYKASSVFNNNDNNEATSLKHIFEPIIMECFGNNKIIDIKCLRYCSFCMDSNFDIYCWGKIKSDCRLVSKMRERKNLNRQNGDIISDEIDLTDFGDFNNGINDVNCGVLKIEFVNNLFGIGKEISVGYSHLFVIHKERISNKNRQRNGVSCENVQCFGTNSGFECLTNSRALSYDDQVLTNLKWIDKGMMDGFWNRNENIIDIICGRECTLVVTFTL